MRYLHGPYPHGRRWRVTHRGPDGRLLYLSFKSRPEAVRAREHMLREQDRRALAALSSPMALPRDPVWVYMLLDDGGKVVYVGATRDLDGRLFDHREGGVPFATMTFYPEVFDREAGLDVEAALIRKHAPELNKTGRMAPYTRPEHHVERPRLETRRETVSG